MGEGLILELGVPMCPHPKPETRILVVEDDGVVRHTICVMLEQEGYEVSTADDGFDALLHLEHETPAVIISDLNMPQMSGFELLSVVRRRFPNILVVATSGAYESVGVPSGVIADAFYAKGQESAKKLLDIVSDPNRPRATEGRKCSRLDSAKWQRPRWKTIRSSDLHGMLAVVSIYCEPRTQGRSSENSLHLLSPRSDLHH